jgi:aryl-alcohol dehydrogenase-like predicted oxidoreductase
VTFPTGEGANDYGSSRQHLLEAVDRCLERFGVTHIDLLQRPTVATIIIGARNEAQLTENLGAAGWQLTAAQIAALDAANDVPPPYPIWHQRGFPMLNERGSSASPL